MHVSVSRLIAGDSQSAINLTAYYTETTQARVGQFSPQELEGMVGYYTETSRGARWLGGSCAPLGLTPGSTVDPKHLRRVLRQLNPNDGSKLPNNGGMRAKISAMDLTFSAEKDLSILWMLGDEVTRRQLEAIMDAATQEAIAFMEEQGAVVRRGAGGLVTRSSSGFLAMQIDHATARPVDGNAAPHLHRHYLIMNLAEADGAWTALDAKPLFNLQKTAAAIAGQVVREQTAKLFGVTWTRDDEGIARIDGFDASLRDRLSLRQQQILDKAVDEGLDVTNRDDWVHAQRTSREGKNACGDDPHAVDWAIEMLLAEGITYTEVMASLHGATQRKVESRAQAVEDRAWVESHFGSTPTGELESQQWRVEVAKRLSNQRALGTVVRVTDKLAPAPGSPKGLPIDWARYKAAMSVDTRSPEDVADGRAHDALINVGRKNSTWRYKDLIIALTDADSSLAVARSRADKFIASSEVVRLFGVDDDPSDDRRVRWDDQPLFATAETLDKEYHLIEATKNGVGTLPPLLTEAQFGLVLKGMVAGGKTIDEDSDQYDMLHTLLCGGNAIDVVSGQAGSGKSTGMEAYNAALRAGYIAQAAGYLGANSGVSTSEVKYLKVVGCALGANAAANLQHESDLHSFSIAMLLTRLEGGSVVLDPGALIIVDEASQASTAQLFELEQQVALVGGRLVLVGDQRQLQAVEAGGLFRQLIEDVPDACIFLDETRRQKNLSERAILGLLHDATSDKIQLNPRTLKALRKQKVDAEVDLENLAGIDAIKDWYTQNNRIVIHQSGGEAAVAIARAYWDAVEANANDVRKAALVMARSNEEIRLLDRAIVEEAKTRRHLDAGAVVEFSNRTFLVGQRVVSRKVDRTADVLNGYIGAVVGVEEVIDKWDLELSSPSPYPDKQLSKVARTRGQEVTKNFTQLRVFNERKNAGNMVRRRTEQVNTAKAWLESAHTDAARVKASDTLSDRVDKLSEALNWLTWANDLPTEGGPVSLTVTKVKAQKAERRLVIEIDDDKLEGDRRRYLSPTFVKRHIDSGYAVTTQRAQSLTVRIGIEYGQLSYVGLTRGSHANYAHLVVPPINQAIADEERASAAPAIEWLAETLGMDEAAGLLSASATALRSGSPASTTQIHDNLFVAVETAADTTRVRLAREVAQAHRLGERSVAVTKTRAMAGDLSDAVVSQLVAEGQGTVLPATIGERQWVRNMPIILARGELEGMIHGETYWVTQVAKRGMFIEAASGTKFEISAQQIRDHFDSGFVVTVARAQEGIDADRYSVVGAGLTDLDLAWVGEQTIPTELIVTNPDVACEHAYYLACDAAITQAFEDEIEADKRSFSATWFKNHHDKEVGLTSLQAEVRMAAALINDDRGATPRELATRDLEEQMALCRRQRRDLELVIRGHDGESPEDQDDAELGVVRLDGKLTELDQRYQLTTGPGADDDPLIAVEIAASALLHALAPARLASAEKDLARYTQARVTYALKNPSPYHYKLPVDPMLGAAPAARQRLELLAVVEEYRAKWGIKDPMDILGKIPEGGIQSDEWAQVMQVLNGIDEREVEYER